MRLSSGSRNGTPSHVERAGVPRRRLALQHAVDGHRDGGTDAARSRSGSGVFCPQLDVVAGWIDSSLPPSLRYRLGTVADRLSIVAKALPPASHGNAYRLAARFYGAAGRLTKAITVAEEAIPSMSRPLDGHAHASPRP